MAWGREIKALERKDARSAYALPDQKLGKPYGDSWDIDRIMAEAMRKVIPIFRGVHAIADNQARLPIEVAKGSEDGEAIPDHPLVRLLNQKPNPDESPYHFRYRLSAQTILSRKGAFVYTPLSRGGTIAAAYLLDPRKTKPVPSESLSSTGTAKPQDQRLISHYEVDLGQGRKDEIPAEEVVWIKLPHPFDPLAGMTPLEAAGLTIDIDTLAKLYNRTFLQNDARPGGIVGVKGEMDDDVADELDSTFNRHQRVGRVTIIEADGLDYVDTATTPRDAQYIEALALSKIDLLGALGVPESVAYGNASGRTFDNAAAEWGIFWLAGMLGHLALLGDGLNQADKDPDTFVRFNLESVDVIQRTQAARRSEMRDEVKQGVRTLDSYLAEIGGDPTDTPEGRSYWRPMGDTPYVTEGQDAPILSIVQETAEAAAKAVLDGLERKQVVAPFRYAPRRGAS